MRPSDIKREIKALEWIVKWVRTRSAKGICLLLLIIFLFIVLQDLSKYSKAQELAFKIYPEVLSNVKELDKFIKKRSDPSWITMMFDRPELYRKETKLVFIFENYDIHYSTFGKNKINTQIVSFYINLKKYNSNYSVDDIASLLDQGKAVLKNLNHYFGCEDFFEAKRQQRNIASGQTGIAVFSPTRYFRYKFK